MDGNEYGCIRRTNRPKNAGVFPWLSAINRAVGEFGVLRTCTR